MGKINHYHGKTKLKIYRRWADMKSRCNSRKHKRYIKTYQDRGITYGDEWKLFENFYRDMGEMPSDKHTLDRIDNDKGYYKENCRWISNKEQQRNTSKNVFLEFDGQRKCISEWAEIYGSKHAIITKRLKMGWSIEDCITKPINNKYSHKKIK